MSRSSLPPEIYAKYQASLLAYLRSTRDKLDSGAAALDAVVHAVSLLEDDELFNCGRGAVFTSAGTIELEASVMVTTLRDEGEVEGEHVQPGSIKRGAGVICLKNVRHPVQLARECLVRCGYDESGNRNRDGGNLHSQLAGPYAETLAREYGLEFQPDEWFRTEKRWEEHLRGLREEEGKATVGQGPPLSGADFLPMGTVGCVALDQWGNLAVATSTGGMTNKLPGRVGDTPTLGAGFWAETWTEDENYAARAETRDASSSSSFWDIASHVGSSLADWICSQSLSRAPRAVDERTLLSQSEPFLHRTGEKKPPPTSVVKRKKRAVAVSGTGNGDSYLRVAAARTACAMIRFSSPNAYPKDLGEAVTAIAGPQGELQRSAGRRWEITGEGRGGIIGIEAEMEVDNHINAVVSDTGCGLRRGRVVFDFNCSGMYRAWFDETDVERVMVFKEEY